MQPVFFAFLYPWVSLGLFSNYILKSKRKEKNKLIRTLSATIIFIGCYLITIAD